MQISKTIGIFDSGIGGLSILKTLLDSPISEFVYIADTAYLPYGQQSKETLLERGRVITQLFLDRGITTIVVACHTSSATTLPTLIKKFPQVTFIDMLEPTITKAAQETKNNKVGVFATPATIASHSHKKLFQKAAPEIQVVEQPCPKLVPLIEADNQTELVKAVHEYLEPMKKAGVDTLILGCTHYAFIADMVQQIAPELQLVSAHKEAFGLFGQGGQKEEPIVKFVTSGNTEDAKRFCNYAVSFLTA
jgi:glutamate racemase